MRTQSASRRWQRLVAGLVSLSLPAMALAYTMGAFGPGGVWAAAPKVASFEFQPLAGDTAQGDGLTDSAAWDYADYRVAQRPAPVCVDAEAGPGSPTQVAFLVSSFNPPFAEHGGFEIKSNSAATVTGTSSVRTVSYVGTASLVKFVIGEKTKAVGGTFPLRMHMVFQRTTP